MSTGQYRGHKIECNDGKVWRFIDSGEKVSDNVNINCGHCGKNPTKEDHDACLGTLIGCMNACCGHGNISDAYIQFLDGNSIRGEDAIIIQNILKKYKGG